MAICPQDGQIDSTIFLAMIVPTIIIVLIQYPFINSTQSWILKLLFFYLSMLLFLFFFGLILSWNQEVGSNPAGSIIARLDGSARMVFLGHFFGLPYFPVIILFNFILRRKLFFQFESS